MGMSNDFEHAVSYSPGHKNSVRDISKEHAVGQHE